jgi:choline dehydrogenase-like flavoprotein
MAEVEVCIVGAGAAGGVMAWELARRGIRVVVLESGPRHDFARRADYTKRFVRGGNPWETPLAGLDRYTSGGSVPYQLEWRRARGVGGSTLHWEGYTLRFHASDFRLRTLYGIAEDWPIAYEDLEPFYGAAEKALGVAGRADDPWASRRSTPFPLPPFALSYSDGLFAGACKRLGVTLHHLPQARNSIAYGGRSQCQACGTCHVCPTGAKASVDLTHIPQAEATDNVRVLTDVTALRIEVDRSGRVSSVVYAGHDKQERRLSATLFVVAAGAIETARLLLLSASREFPQGLANRSGMVGKNFMSQPYIDVTGDLKDRVYPYRTGFSTAMTRQFAAGRDRSSKGGFFLEFLNSTGPTPAAIAQSSGKWGEALRRQVQQEFGHTLGIRIYCEQLPDPRNSISLNRQVKDYFGSPVPHIVYDLGRYERATLDEAKTLAGRILQAMGAVSIRSSDLSMSGHQIGVHRMGTDPQASVVDANLRTHDVSNLYLVGSGCFVTASSSPPTLTIVALAIRAAEHIASLLRAGGRAEPVRPAPDRS